VEISKRIVEQVVPAVLKWGYSKVLMEIGKSVPEKGVSGCNY